MSKNGRITVQGFPGVLRIHLCVKKNNHMKSLIEYTPDVTRLSSMTLQDPSGHIPQAAKEIVIVDVIGF
jgi:hypothetical protein